MLFFSRRMGTPSSILGSLVLVLLGAQSIVDAHIVLTYPGWRGDNLITNETYPYGMQWMYPCGGHPPTTNRTKWPVTGGAVAFQPGWFQGHATAFMYINLGFGTDGPGGGPKNMSFPMVPVFQMVGPSKNPFPGTMCLPQVPLPVNHTVKVGDNATIQVVETALHGAALYSCVDITFALPEDVAEVNETNCFNSTDLSFNNVYSVAVPGSTSGAGRAITVASSMLWVPLIGGLIWGLL